MKDKKKFTIAIVGNPNCGKTTLFNGLTGGKQKIGNWPGVTVEKKEGKIQINNNTVNIIDLPGIYSLSAYSEDEKVSRDYILSGEPDLVINVIDATNLERNLYLTTQLIEMKAPMIILVNMIDIAKKQNILLKTNVLSRKTGISVFEISAIYRSDVDRVKEIIIGSLDENICLNTHVVYPNEIEDIIQEWSPSIRNTAIQIGADTRWVALKILENDSWIINKIIKSGELDQNEISVKTKKIEHFLGDSPDIILADYRYGFIHGLLEETYKREPDKKDITDKIDQILLNKFIGLPIFLLIMYLVFWLTMNLGSVFIDFFDIFTGAIFVDSVRFLLTSINSPAWIISILADGIGSGIQTISTFIPVIFMLFLILSILEDSGYMARAAFLMDKYMRIIGLPGKSFVPLIVGFGCTVPAVLATRTLENRQDKYLTIFLAPLMSCGARFPVYFIFAAAFFPHSTWNIVFSIYLSGIAFAVLNGLLIKNTLFKGEVSHFIIELPPYHMPRLNHIMLHTWTKLKDFIFKAGKIIIIAMAVFGILNSISVKGEFGTNDVENSILSKAGKIVTPLFKPLGIEKNNWPASVALLSGIFAKESIVGTLNAMYNQINSKHNNISEEERSFNFLKSLKDAFMTIPLNFKELFFSTFRFLNKNPEPGNKDDILFKLMRKYFVHGKFQVYAYLLFVLIYFPCIPAFSTIMKEGGIRFGIFIAFYLTFTAWLIATLFYQVAAGHNILWIILPSCCILCIIILFYVIGKLDLIKFISTKSDKTC